MSLNASCLSGSRRPAPRPEQHGVCWQQCNCDAAGKECGFTQECVGFSCDAGFRRQGIDAVCVQDECIKVGGWAGGWVGRAAGRAGCLAGGWV